MSVFIMTVFSPVIRFVYASRRPAAGSGPHLRAARLTHAANWSRALTVVSLAMGWAAPGEPAPTREPAVLETGINPASIAVSDVNGDGNQDVLVANYGGFSPPYTGSVSVLLGNGDGTFGARTDYPTGVASTGIAVGDLNGDERPDVVVANYAAEELEASCVSVLLGRGDGTFQPSVNYLVGVSPYSVAIGDFDGDGVPDLAVANWNSHTVSQLLGSGDGTFAPKTDVATGSVPKSVTAEDFDRNGRADVVVANLVTDDVSVFMSEPNGSFRPRVDYRTDFAPTGVRATDVNLDGIPDLAVSCAHNSVVSVLLGTGDGTFHPRIDFEVDELPWSLATGDVNSDDNPDLVTANYSGNTASVLLGFGDGTFSPASNYCACHGPVSVAIADLDNDGNEDLAVACNAYRTGRVSVLWGEGNGIFAAADCSPLTPAPARNLLLLSPNPTPGPVNISFTVARDGPVELSVFDVLGRRLTLLRNTYQAGYATVSLDASRWTASTTPGLFFVRVVWPGGSTIGKLVVAK